MTPTRLLFLVLGLVVAFAIARWASDAPDPTQSEPNRTPDREEADPPTRRAS